MIRNIGLGHKDIPEKCDMAWSPRTKQPSRVALRLLTQPRAKEQKVSPFRSHSVSEILIALSKSSLRGHRLPRVMEALGLPHTYTFPGPFCVALGYWHTDRRESITLMPASIHPFTSPLPDTLCVLQEGKCRLPGAWALYCNRKGPGNQGLLEITV